MKDDHQEIDNAENGVSVQRRRDFIKLAGKVAILTPPVMMGLASPSAHATAKSGIGNYHGYKRKGYKLRKIRKFKQKKASYAKYVIAKVKFALRGFFS